MQRSIRLFICKILQRRIYDIFTNKHSVLLCFAFFSIILIAFFHIIEVLVLNHKIINKRYLLINDSINQNDLCQHLSIDAVYTWVNGSDPKLLRELQNTRKKIQYLISETCSKKYCESNEKCIETPIAFIKPIVENPFAILNNVTKFENFKDSGSLIYFSNLFTAREQTERCSLSHNTSTYSITTAYIMLDESNNFQSVANNNVISVSSMILLTNNSTNTTMSQLIRYLSPFTRKQIQVINIYEHKRIALLSIKNLNGNVSKVLRTSNSTLNRTLENLKQTFQILYPVQLTLGHNNILNESDKLTDVSESRFADNEELRYSLRSLEVNAPWIRNVYIVTNGQIPYWLNLENPRVKVITHDEIFINKSHLPTFSSPAIETHLHRIPNLSKKFLYLNDDILLGKPVWPEDFYTKSKGYKVYLSWPVPNCADGCPMNWLKDGYCDNACNKSECLWDGGDCDPRNANHLKPIIGSKNRFDRRNSGVSQVNSGLNQCSANCANNWLSDKFCDQVCNNKECAFDLGDCGTKSYNYLFGVTFNPKRQLYVIPFGTNAVYFNMTKFLLNPRLDINEMHYENNTAVRSAAMNMKHKILTLLFYPNHETTNITILLKGMKNNTEFIIRFQALVISDERHPRLNETQEFSTDEDILIEEIGEENNITKDEMNYTYNFTFNPTINIDNSHLDNQYPKILGLDDVSQDNFSFPCDIKDDQFSNELKVKLNEFDNNLKKGLLTDKGFLNYRKRLIKLYINQICNYKTAIKQYDNTISAFKWEKQSTFSDIENAISAAENENKADTKLIFTRHLMDTYADSLRHVNQIYNQVFGLELRKVPAHIAHFVDVDIMTRLQSTFPHQFDITSSHRIRSSDDMQFAFSYYYFLISEKKQITISDIFDNFDVDGSRSWSLQEIRSVIIILNELPLKTSAIKEFYSFLSYCCADNELCPEQIAILNVTHFYYRATYIDHSLEIPKSIITECENITNKLVNSLSPLKANKFEVMGEEEISFKMIRSNTSILEKELDELSKHRKKFMCLNDNIEHLGEMTDTRTVQAMLVQFYESMFPRRSQFERALNERNKFSYIHEYYEYNRKQITFERKVYVLVILSIMLSTLLCIIFKKCKFKLQITKFYRRFIKRKLNTNFQHCFV